MGEMTQKQDDAIYNRQVGTSFWMWEVKKQTSHSKRCIVRFLPNVIKKLKWVLLLIIRFRIRWLL